MKFLVVDDIAAILNLVSSILKLFGHGADEANDGFEAIEQIQNHRYDVVITDAEMPRIDGLALCKYLKSQESGIYIIGMSGSLTALQGLKEAGADVCLSKPFSLHSLEEAIAHLLPCVPPQTDSLQPVA